MPPLPTDVLARIDRLELEARQVVEGHLAGRHKSPRYGFAVEFAQHREYAPGDDIKHIDWKVYGRTERYHLKQYEQETNLVAWLVVDASESMRYGSGERTKYDVACSAAASLAYLVLQQTDAVGLATVAGGVRHFLRPSARSGSHFRELLRLLADGPSTEPAATGKVLDELAGRLGRRGIVFVVSDLLDDVPDLLAGIRHLRYQKHEIVVLHVLDAAELDFPFRHPTLFRGLEQLPQITTDPLTVRESYLDQLGRHLAAIEEGCRTLETDYVRIRTDADLGVELATYLRKRGGK
jgi:uncharacterized protein (DUF58 family)